MEVRHGIGDEHPQAHVIMIFCAILFITIWILDSFLFHISIGLTKNNNLLLRLVLFLFITILSVKLGMSSHKDIFDHPKDSSSLVTNGVFSYIRHPMYLSILLIKLAFVLLTMSLVSIIPWVISVLLYDKVASYEERELEKILGKEYVEYKKKVSRWIPKLSSFMIKISKERQV